jgi:NAD(P)-dependent dehydrogenase (short-subunit alcohol dehydrogenase family)
MEISLSQKVAIVTGAASGIGKAVARAYLVAGVTGLVAVDRSEQLEEALSSLAKEHAGKIAFVHGDVSEEQTAKDYTRAAIDHFGRIDVLVSNAAISVVKPLHLHTPEEWDSVMNVNVRSVYWATRHVIPAMIEQRSGLILLTGSISGCVGIPAQGAYAPSKAALHEMAKQLAVEYAPYGIRVNSIACGTVDTPLVHSSAAASGDPDAFWAMLRNAHPIGRIASADEVADFYTYMASDRASFFTGAVIMMDGGYTAR